MRRPFLLAGLVLLAGCATIKEPPGAVVVERPAFPAAGTQWVTRTTGDQRRTLTWTVLSDGTWNGRPVHRVATGPDVVLVDPATHNYVARLVDDAPAFVMTPHDGRFTWPLYVGKRWEARFAAEDLARRRSFPDVRALWSVEAWEPVTVPAGTFTAFRLRSRPLQNSGVATVLWYAPAPGIVVREITDRGDTPDIPGGRSVTELVEAPRR